MNEAATEQLAEALGKLVMAGMTIRIITFAIAVFIAIAAFKIIVWIIKLPFRIVRRIIYRTKKPKTDYGYNTVYDTNDKWEYNERKRRWEPKENPG